MGKLVHKMQAMISDRQWRWLSATAARLDASMAAVLRALIDDAIEREGWIDTGFQEKSVEEKE